MNKLLMLLSNIQRVIPNEDSIEIAILPYNEVQVTDIDNMPTNYQYTEEQCTSVLSSLQKIVDYMYKDELSNYIEWKSDQGVFIEGIDNNATSESIDKRHIFHDVLILQEILSSVTSTQL